MIRVDQQLKNKLKISENQKRYSNKKEEDCCMLVSWVSGCCKEFDIPNDICVSEFCTKNQN